MIGRLQGIILEKQAPELLLDVQGVGYDVTASLTTFGLLGKVGEAAVLHTHLVVREDAQLLYGFAEKSERALFRTLIKVNGVGPKMAITILSGMDANALASCIQMEDMAALTKLPGVGKKTAERLIVEMRDKLKAWETSAPLWAAADAQEQASTHQMVAEAEQALIALGYKPAEAAKMLNKIATQANTSEALIRLALRNTLGH